MLGLRDLLPRRQICPAKLAICDDERQFVPATGQGWVTREASPPTIATRGGSTNPACSACSPCRHFAINQRAFLVLTPTGNILWDCVALLDAATEALMRGSAGSRPSRSRIRTITPACRTGRRLSTRRSFCMRPIASGSCGSLPAAPLLGRRRARNPPLDHTDPSRRPFAGSTVLHWGATADGAGALLAGDIVQVTPGARRATFMRSYPNMMPLSAAAVRQIAARLAPWPYRRIYGAFAGQDVLDEGRDRRALCRPLRRTSGGRRRHKLTGARPAPRRAASPRGRGTRCARGFEQQGRLRPSERSSGNSEREAAIDRVDGAGRIGAFVRREIDRASWRSRAPCRAGPWAGGR